MYPTYKITVDDIEQGITFISLVDSPAIKIKGLAFGEHKNKTLTIPLSFTNKEEKNFSFSNKEGKNFSFSSEKQIIAGPTMIPDISIYREDEEMGKFYVVFDKQTIRKIVEKFNKNPHKFQINVDHTEKIVDAYMLGNWFVEDNNFDKSRKYGFDNLPIGTHFAEVKIDDAEFWEKQVKGEGKFGFSVEGLFGLKINKNSIINNSIQMEKEKLKLAEVEVSEINLEYYSKYVKEDGSIIYINNDSIYIQKGDVVEKAPVGEYRTQSNYVSTSETIITVTEPGNISSSVSKETEDRKYLGFKQVKNNKMEKLKFAKVESAEAKYFVEGEVAIGNAIYTLNEETLEKEVAKDGDITLSDGQMLVIKGGKIAEIKPATVPTTEEDMKKTEDAPKPATEAKVENVEAPAAPATEAPATTPALDEAKVIEIIDAKIAEVYKAIAEMKNAMDSKTADVEKEEVMENKEQSFYEKLVAFKQFKNKQK